MPASVPSGGGVPQLDLAAKAAASDKEEAATGLAPPLPKHVTKTMSKLAAGVGQESNLEIGFTIYSLTSIDPVEQTQWTQRTQRTQWNACSTGSMSYWLKPFNFLIINLKHENDVTAKSIDVFSATATSAACVCHITTRAHQVGHRSEIACAIGVVRRALHARLLPTWHPKSSRRCAFPSPFSSTLLATMVSHRLGGSHRLLLRRVSHFLLLLEAHRPPGACLRPSMSRLAPLRPQPNLFPA